MSNPSNGDPKSEATAKETSSNQAESEIKNTGPPRNGKIATLSKELRDLVNQMLSDGLSSPAIIEKLAERGVSLNKQNISNWKRGGYLDWVEQQELLAEINSERESAVGLLAGGDESSFHQAVLQIALTQIFKTLRRQQLRDDPSNYTRLLNALARIARETLVAKKYRDVSAKEKAAELKPLDPERDFNEKEHNIFMRGAERLFGFKPDRPIGPPLAEVLAKLRAAQTTPAPNGDPSDEPKPVP